MKVGITINDTYRNFIEEIAILNKVSFSRVCSLILENFLSYNKLKHRKPIFVPCTKMSFVSADVDEITSSTSIVEDDDLDNLDWNQLLADLEEQK